MIILHAAGNEKIGLGNLTRVKALVKYLCSIKYNNFKVILEAREDIAKMFIVDDVDYFIAENRKIAQKFLEDNMFNKSSEKLVLISDLVDMNYSDNEFYRRCGFDVLIQINDENVNKFNPDIYINSDIFYQEFNVNSQTKIYSGSKFLVVRDEILKQRPLECWNKDKIENILVCFGGSDPARYTEDIVKLIRNNMVYDNYNFNVVLGPGVSDERKRELIKNANHNIKFLVNEKHMERKIIENDLIITLGGLTTYEALALGRPVCCIGWEYMNYYVDNLSKNNWIYKLGNKSKDLEGLEKCLLDIDRLKAIASKGFKNINHRGAENMVNIAIKAEKGEI